MIAANNNQYRGLFPVIRFLFLASTGDSILYSMVRDRSLLSCLGFVAVSVRLRFTKYHIRYMYKKALDRATSSVKRLGF